MGSDYVYDDARIEGREHEVIRDSLVVSKHLRNSCSSVYRLNTFVQSTADEWLENSEMEK